MEFPAYPSAVGPRLRWSAVFAGVVVTLALLAALNILGVGLNFLAAAGAEVAAGAVPGATAGNWWTLLSGIAAFYAGAWFAARLSDSGRRADGVIFGLVAWATAALVSIFLPAAALGGVMTIGASGLFVFAAIALQAGASALGGLTGARLYLPVPVTEYRKSHHREVAPLS
ncbi:MAG TPA: hypothetical protein VH309_12375 [Elusimicrobiota bacterium]|jgi:hypothetical protein|nr:hypothetical protein [Elusimicrobiota bacterium]